MSRSSSFQPLSSLFDNYQVKRNKYISQEFQDYGLRLAHELNDLAHKSLYIRLAKREKRSLLESARSYVADARVRSKARVFMWKLKQLRRKRQQSPHKDDVKH